MATEIERKFLVSHDGWQATAGAPARLRQGYLKDPSDGVSEVRVRITQPAVGNAFASLGVKSVGGLTRTEVEASIPVEEAEVLMELCQGRVLSKRRHVVPTGTALAFEVDVYEGLLAGLVTADCEIPNEGADVPRPDWLGEEITGRLEYANAVLCQPGRSADWLAADFRQMVAQWRTDTDFLSSAHQICGHPIYQRIVGLGPGVVPLIIEELRDEGGHWFSALQKLTGEDPAPEGSTGDYATQRQAWLDWGTAKGF